MAESVEQELSPVLKRTRSNAMVLEQSDKITTDNEPSIEKSTEQTSKNPVRLNPDCGIITPKLEDKPTQAASIPHFDSNGAELTPSQLEGHAPEEMHDRNIRPQSKLDRLSSEREEDGCKQCKELQSTISLWELGVSGLTRNYSKILSQLNKVRNTAEKLEGRLEKGDITSSLGPVMIRNSSVSGRKSNTVRQSMYVSGAPPPPANIAEQMYPQESSRSNSVSSGSTKLLKDLNSHLSQAIDLCQQMAAATFKSNQRSSKQRLRRHITVESNINGENSNFRPALQSIAENNLSGSYKKRTLKRTPSAPDSLEGRPTIKLANGLSSDMEPTPDNESHPAAINGADRHTDSTNEKPYYSHMMELCSKDKLEDEKSMELSRESDSRSEEDFRESIWSSASTFSDGDVKQIMSKIADLEEERIKLLGTIDDLHKDNNCVRLSLGEILGDLENKDLQLTLAMQDLSIATGEIRRAAEMRKLLQGMESERNELLERLGNLEDESTAVKVSLIQLLQEKSATNKTLALENWRLNQKMKASTLRRPSTSEGDNVSVMSGFSSLTEDATLQEAYMGADDVASFVHKQGFLVKQGGRRKNWKNRLFVLSPEGLSYYKTEQPVQILPIDKINKVQISHGRTGHPYPNIFEVHTPGRVFLLSAPTEDDMQSWVGMLQTLKQYNKGTTLNREASTRRALAVESASPLSPAEVTNVPSDSDTESNHRLIHQSVVPEGKGISKIALDDSSDDDSLTVHSRHGSEIDISSPRSVPVSTLDNAASFGHPSPKPFVRLRSDSCS